MESANQGARQGRDNQRYETVPSLINSGASVLGRLIVGSVPYSFTDGNNRSFSVLMINSRKHPEEWLFPKGGFETDETMEQCAARETWEEAGCEGVLGPVLVLNEHISGKKKKKDEVQIHSYYSFEVSSLKEDWPERDERGRKYFSAADARQMLDSQLRRKDRLVMLKSLDALEAYLI